MTRATRKNASATLADVPQVARGFGRPVANRVWTPRTTAKPAGGVGTHKSSHRVPYDASDIRLVYGGWTASVGSPYGDTDLSNSAPLPVRAAIEYPSGTVTPITFSGQRTGQLDNGGLLASDPVGVFIPAGAQFWVRTFLNTASGDLFPAVGNSTGNAEGEGFVATNDLTAAGSGAIAQSNSNIIRPVGIFGRTASPRAVGIVGDSIASGQGDYGGYGAANARSGFIARAFHAANIPYTSISVPGELAGRFASSSTGHIRRLPLLAGCTSVICEYGINDLQQSLTPTPTFQIVATSLVSVWKLLALRGLKTWQTTISPSSTSTDGWITTGAQTANPAHVQAARIAVNDWIRAGAPLDSTLTPVTPGTLGAIFAGMSGHPLAGYIEVADLVESSRNSGLWKVGPTRTVTDGAINSGSAVLTSATAAFTSADLGKSVAITGSGASGGIQTAVIGTVNTSSQVTLDGTLGNAATSVTGATVKIGDIYTSDGLHPSGVGNAAMSAFDVSALA